LRSAPTRIARNKIVLRRHVACQAGGTIAITEAEANVAVTRLSAWHLHRASVAPLVTAAWRYHHNMTAADALYVALAETLGGDSLADGHQLVQAPTFPTTVNVLALAVRP
jgi:predicted nucleic acid-binding protein